MSNKKKRFDRKSKRARNRWFLLLIAGVVLVGLAFLIFRKEPVSQPLASIEVHGAPSLKADREQIDLGNVKLGQTVQVSFRLTNVGDQPLRFSEQPYIELVEGC